MYCAEELTILTGVPLFLVEQLHGARYNIQDAYNSLALHPIAFVRNQDLPSALFVLNILLHGLDYPLLAFQKVCSRFFQGGIRD